MNTSIVIPTRNGWGLLRKNLPILIGSNLPAGTEILVVDDCSDDQTVERGERAFPGIRFISRSGEEPGFCHAVNLGMQEAGGDHLLLLNNDVVFGKDTLMVMAEHLSASPGYFYVAVPLVRRPDGSDEGEMVYVFRHGLAQTAIDGPGIPYPSGACSLWRRSAWEALDGLDTDYAPGYWEDTDIGARAFQRGWKILKVTGTEVRHEHAATMGHSITTETLRERNRFIFMRKHCRSPVEKVSMAFWLPLHLARAVLTGNRAFLKGYRDFLGIKKGR